MTSDQLRDKIIELLDALEGTPVLTVQSVILALTENDAQRLEVFCDVAAMMLDQ